MTNDNDEYDLFPAHTRARSGDPWTSHAQAERIAPKINERQAIVLDIHRKHRNGLTNWELETLAGSHNSTWRTRVSELVRKGVIVNSGRHRRIPSSDDPRADRIVWICRNAEWII